MVPVLLMSTTKDEADEDDEEKEEGEYDEYGDQDTDIDVEIAAFPLIPFRSTS